MAVPLPHLFIHFSPIGCRSLLSCCLLSFVAISDFHYYSQSNVVCHSKFPTKPLESPINFTLCSSLKCKSINEGEQLHKRVCYNVFPSNAHCLISLSQIDYLFQLFKATVTTFPLPIFHNLISLLQIIYLRSRYNPAIICKIYFWRSTDCSPSNTMVEPSKLHGG